MKYVWEHIAEIKHKIEARNFLLLFLDFDGTLAPLAPNPHAVFLTKETALLLKKLQKHASIIPVIVSGRPLENIKNIVRIENMIYAGNHGLEWKMHKKQYVFNPSKRAKQALQNLRGELNTLCTAVEGTFLEDKSTVLTLHYRLVNEPAIPFFKEKVKKLLLPYTSSGVLTMTKGKKVYDIRPHNFWTKGHFCQFLIHIMRKAKKHKPLAVYIGDDETDEDAFGHLKDAITIKVGENASTKATYYVKNNEEVSQFMAWVLEHG